MKALFSKNPWEGDVFAKAFNTNKSKKVNINFGSGGSGLPNLPQKSLFLFGFIALVALWLLSGLYKIDPGEKGVITRFGKYERTSFPGLNYKLPAPIENLTKVKVTRVNKTNIGFKEKNPGQRYGRNIQNSKMAYQGYQEISEPDYNKDIIPIEKESLMLTGDENIIDINFQIQWRIKSAKDYLFNTKNPVESVKSVAESAMREIVGVTDLATALSVGRSDIEQNVKGTMQQILDEYGLGVEIILVQLLKVDPPKQVINASREVQTARADKEKAINQAQAYKNALIPEAKGQAARIIEDAKGYYANVVNNAKGKADRFNQVYKEYANSKTVTRKSMYIEAISEILTKSEKVIIDSSKGSSLPYLFLDNKRQGSVYQPTYQRPTPR